MKKQPMYKGTFPGGSRDPMSMDAPPADMGAGEIDSPVETRKARMSQNQIENAGYHHGAMAKKMGIEGSRKAGRYPGGTGRSMA